MKWLPHGSYIHAINGSYLQNRKHNGRSVKWYVDEAGFSAGDYEVFVKSFKAPDDGTQTTYQVKSGVDTTLVDIPHQGLIPGYWVSLGIHTFDARQNDQSSQWVLLDGDANTSGLLGTFLVADAVKLVAYVPLAPKDIKYIHNDHLGTPQVVTDDTGTIIWTASYAPFGEASVNEDVDGDGSDYELNIRFPGQYFDQESGLHYNYFRDYDPGTGRYIESDPIGLSGGVNTYGYVNSNPIAFIDPLGLGRCIVSGDIKCCLAKIFGQSEVAVDKVRITPNSVRAKIHFIGQSYVYAATTRKNTIWLTHGCDTLFNDYNFMLHEFHHVFNQWNNGRMGRLSYLRDPDKRENEADNFANRNERPFADCLANGCTPCQ